MVNAKCVICCYENEVDDYMLLLFPQADIICPRCNKAMKWNNKEEKKVEVEVNASHPHDPRPDLSKDAKIWVELLKRMFNIKKELYYIFHGMRCAGSKLELKDENIKFTFSNEFDDNKISEIREKYLIPNKDLIKITMRTLAKDMNKKELSLSDCPY